MALPVAAADWMLAPSSASASTLGAVVTAVCVLLLVLLLVLLVLVYGQPVWFMRFVARCTDPSVLWLGRTTSNMCALTIDDAPSASTPLLLDILREQQVKATFFVISGNIPGREDILRRMVSEGHTLGNHLTEDRASRRDDLHIFEQKLMTCDRAIAAFQADAKAQNPAASQGQVQVQDSDPDVKTALLHGAQRLCKWLRPPSGWFTTNQREIAARHEYRICMGSVYPHDAQIHLERLNALYLQTQTRPGSVIIVHDRPWTVGVLRRALPVLTQTKQFKFVSLDCMATLQE